MTRLACLAALLLLFVLSPRMEGTPFLIEGTPAFREATIQAWELVPLSLKVYVRSARVIRQVDDRASPAYDCWPWEQALDACNEGADLDERAIRVTRVMWLGDRRAYAGRLVHEGWHLFATEQGYQAGGTAGEAAAIAFQVATLRGLGYTEVGTLEAAVGVHGKEE